MSFMSLVLPVFVSILICIPVFCVVISYRNITYHSGAIDLSNLNKINSASQHEIVVDLFKIYNLYNTEDVDFCYSNHILM